MKIKVIVPSERNEIFEIRLILRRLTSRVSRLKAARRSALDGHDKSVICFV
jgi:hypothetical protein